jgi:aldehyde:ferredoxin oxidoreductase
MTRAPATVTVVELDLARLAPGRVEPWSALRREFAHGEPALARLGRAGGEALALIELARRDGAFVLAVGDGVRRGLATASRATVVARSPLSGLVADGQVGSDLARRLASLADAFVLSGEARGEVLLCDDDGARVERAPELAGLSPHAIHARLEARFGPCATLAVGPAGVRRVRIANLAACSSSADAAAPPHFVGRGGLGAAFATHGLVALAVSARAIETLADEALAQWLLASPRLLARARDGTLELPESYAARGDLFARGGSAKVEREVAHRFAESIAAAARAAHGCRGCPTPCGVALEGARGERLGARFSAGHALGLNLGLERGEDALALLAACDAFGLDAKELGAGLAWLARAGEQGRLESGPSFGDRGAFLACVEDAAAERGLGALLARGSAAVAREFGFEPTVARGQAVRREASLASLLGQCVASRGPDPMRTFPFLATDAGSRARLRGLLEPLALPERAEDPDAPEGKGRLVWWHENLSAALDATGFCSFSAGSLLADGTTTLDELACVIAPPTWLAESHEPPGWSLLDLGARLIELVRALERRYGARDDVDRPEFARAALSAPGMLDEYLALREGGARGTALERARSLAHVPGVAIVAPIVVALGVGRVKVVTSGWLGDAYGGEVELELELPCTVAEVLRVLEARSPGAPPLFAAGAPVPTVFRSGRRLEPDVAVACGDRLDLVLAISGG